jgi:gliding motility-associated-like protein
MYMRNFLQFPFILLFISPRLFAQAPTATIVAPTSPFCSNAPITFSAVSQSSALAYSWSVSPATAVTIAPSPSAQTITFRFGNPGRYVISLGVTNETLSSVSTTTVNVSRSARAAFNASLTDVGYPSQLVLTNYSTGSNKNVWLFTGVQPDSALNTIKNIPGNGSYSVTLVAFASNGCNDTARYSFIVDDISSVKLPNVFTPNGDGVNDIYRPIATGIVKMTGRVFNRDQVLIATWDRINGYWDGRTTSGEPCDSGVYAVVVDAYGFDGKVYNMRTMVTLIR